MTLGLRELGTVEDLMDSAFSGFDYPNNAQLSPVLSDGTSTRNAVLQQSGLTMRQATLGFVAEDAETLVIRGYYESREEVDFVDYDGTMTAVRLLEFSRTELPVGLWDVMVTMLEVADPQPPGS